MLISEHSQIFFPISHQRSKPYYDNEELLSICYRCSTTHPLHNPKGGNRCSNCGQPFVHSFVSFEILPLVEFALEDGISDAEALGLIESASGPPRENGGSGHVSNGGGTDVMTMDDGSGEENLDPFSNTRLFSFQQDGVGGVGGDLFQPVVVGRAALSAMQPGDVVVFK